MAHATLVVMDCYMPIDEMMSCQIDKLLNNNSEVYINILLSPLNEKYHFKKKLMNKKECIKECNWCQIFNG